MTKIFGLEWIAEGYEKIYDSEENPQVYVEFQAAAGRGGHSTSAGKVT